jgi:RNA-binding protein
MADYNAAMELSEKQKKYLRRLAHPLRPIVLLGNAGLTDGIVKEFDRALTDHELVKVSARIASRAARNAALATLASRTCAELVQRVGHVGLFYRRRQSLPKILIPDQ